MSSNFGCSNSNLLLFGVYHTLPVRTFFFFWYTGDCEHPLLPWDFAEAEATSVLRRFSHGSVEDCLDCSTCAAIGLLNHFQTLDFPRFFFFPELVAIE